MDRCLTCSCHSAGIWRTRSRAVTTTCTSVSAPNDAIARAACSSVAEANSSCETSTVPVHASASRTSRSQAPTARSGCCLRPARLADVERGEVVVEEPLQRQEQPLLGRQLRCDHRTPCRNVVPVLGLPTWRKTRRAAAAL